MKTQLKADMNYCRRLTEVKIVVAAQKRGRFTLDNRGFTLVELIVVCTIIGVLATMALPVFSDVKTKANVSRCAMEIRALEKDITAYATDHGSYPNDLNAINRGNLKDPWGHSYIYYRIPEDHTGAYTEYGGGWLNNDFDLYSWGKDGRTSQDIVAPPAINDSSDDIIRGGDGGVVELGSDW